jgi:malonyl-CoA O-methyltransferase
VKESAHHRAVRHRFSASAATYDEYARVQRDVARALLSDVPSLADAPRILEAGCGTGRLTRLLLDRYPSARIDAFDASPRMIAVARSQVGAEDRVRWKTHAMESFSAGHDYELVISSAALHWVQPLAPVVQRLAACLRPGGHLCAALMVEGTLSELMASRARIAPAKKPRTVLEDAEAVRRAFSGSGLVDLSFRSKRMVEHYPSARAFLCALRAAGLTGGIGSPGSAPLVRDELRRLEEDYEVHYREADGVRATYEVLFVTGQAGMPDLLREHDPK